MFSDLDSFRCDRASRQPSSGWMAGLVFVVFLALYALTAQRGVSWQDSGEFQCRALTGDYVWHSGLARAHPLYVAAARAFAELFPPGQRLFSVTAFSGLGMAVALSLLAATVVRLTGRLRGAVVAVAALGLAHMAWWLATVAEVYTWSLAFLMAELYAAVRFLESRRAPWLVAVFGANGAHVAVHNFAFLDLPVWAILLGVHVVGQLKGRDGGGASVARAAAVPACALAAWVVGASPVLALAAELWRSGQGLAEVARSVLFGSGYEAAVVGVKAPSLGLAVANWALAGVSLASPCWFLAARGWRALGPRGAFRACLATLSAVHLLFWVRYFVPDQATFVLPSLGLLALWTGAGGSGLPFGGRRGLLAWVGAGVAIAAVLPWALGQGADRIGVVRSRALPFRSEAAYWLTPWKQAEGSAQAFVAAAGQMLRPGDVLVADSTSAGALLAARAAGLMTADWRLVTPWSGESGDELKRLAKSAKGCLYVVSPVAGYAPRAVLEAAEGFERDGVLYRAKVRGQ